LLEDIGIIIEPKNCEAPALLRACTRLRNEGKNMFYGANNIGLKEGWTMPQRLWTNEAATPPKEDDDHSHEGAEP